MDNFNERPDFAIDKMPGADRRFPSVTAAGFMMLVLLALMFVFQVLTIFVLELLGLYESLDTSATVNYGANIVCEALYIGLPVLVMLLIYNKNIPYMMRLNPLKMSVLLLTVVLGVLFYFANSMLTNFNVYLASFFTDVILPESPDVITALDKALMMVMLVIVAPLFEEIAMRGIIMRGLEGKSKWFAIIVAGTFFGMLHLTYYTMVPKILGGIMLCYIAYVTDSIYSGIIVHMLNNAFAGLTSLTVETTEEAVTNVSALPLDERIWGMIICGFLSIGLISAVIAVLVGIKNACKKPNADGAYSHLGSVREKLPSEKPVKWYAYVAPVIAFAVMGAIMILDML